MCCVCDCRTKDGGGSQIPAWFSVGMDGVVPCTASAEAKGPPWALHWHRMLSLARHFDLYHSVLLHFLGCLPSHSLSCYSGLPYSQPMKQALSYQPVARQLLFLPPFCVLMVTSTCHNSTRKLRVPRKSQALSSLPSFHVSLADIDLAVTITKLLRAAVCQGSQTWESQRWIRAQVLSFPEPLSPCPVCLLCPGEFWQGAVSCVSHLVCFLWVSWPRSCGFGTFPPPPSHFQLIL